MAESIKVIGSGGATFEVDPENEIIAAQIARSDLVIIEPPEGEQIDRVAEGVTALTGGGPSDAAEWLAKAKPPEIIETLEQTGEGSLDFANALLGFEQGGKGRKTVIAALEAYLEELTKPPSDPDTAVETQVNQED